MFQMLSFFLSQYKPEIRLQDHEAVFVGENYITYIENAKNFEASLLKIVSPLFRAHEILVINIWQKRIY